MPARPSSRRTNQPKPVFELIAEVKAKAQLRLAPSAASNCRIARHSREASGRLRAPIARRSNPGRPFAGRSLAMMRATSASSQDDHSPATDSRFPPKTGAISQRSIVSSCSREYPVSRSWCAIAARTSWECSVSRNSRASAVQARTRRASGRDDPFGLIAPRVPSAIPRAT